MREFPRDTAIDASLRLAVEGYDYVGRRCDALGSDIYEARFLTSPTIFMRGTRWAEVFYDPSKFLRSKAAPRHVLRTLFGKGGVQGLDGTAHRHRKHMFLTALRSESQEQLVRRVEQHFERRLNRWRVASEVVLFDELREILTAAACDWMGISLHPVSLAARADDLESMIEGAGSVGWQHLRGIAARRRCERWLSAIIADVRRGRLPRAEEHPLGEVALHRDPGGAQLRGDVAAVEALNLLRPTVAIARYGMFAAHAIHEHPHLLRRLGEPEARARFVEEIRRHYPFFPAVAARVKAEFEHDGYRFKAGQRVVLDLYGTNHTESSWRHPNRFEPERFADEPLAHAAIPQGGGDVESHHRCAGEAATQRVLNRLVQLLTQQIRYDVVPGQDLSVSRRRIPARVASGFRIHHVVRIGDRQSEAPGAPAKNPAV